MIKINLLPPHILEGRRVKIVAILMGLLVLLTAIGMAGWIWFAPAPVSSLTAQLKTAQSEYEDMDAKASKVEKTQADAAAAQASYKVKQSWVDTVVQADAKPAQWVLWLQRINRYVPSDVVLTSLPLPSGNTLQLTGLTNSPRAAMRWWLNMLRCDMVDTTVNPVRDAVRYTVSTQNDLNAQPGAGVNPRQWVSVNLAITLNQSYLRFLQPVFIPPGMGASGGTRGTSGGRQGRGGSGQGGRGGRGMMGGRGGR